MQAEREIEDYWQTLRIQPGGMQLSGNSTHDPFMGSKAIVSASKQPPAHQPMQSKEETVVGSSTQTDCRHSSPAAQSAPRVQKPSLRLRSSS